MNILHIIPFYYPTIKYGGPVPAIHSLNKALVKKGIKCDVYTTNAGLEDRRDIPFNAWVNNDGVNTKYFKYYGYEHYNFSPDLFFTLIKNIKKYDIIKLSEIWSFPVLAGAISSVINHKPYVVIPHGSLGEEAVRIKSYSKKMINYSLFARRIIKRSSAIRFMSLWEKAQSSKYINGKYNFIIPNGIDVNEYLKTPYNFKNKYPFLKGKRIITYLGRLHKIKGLDLLFESVIQILKTRRDIHLLIIGNDQLHYSKYLKQILNENNIDYYDYKDKPIMKDDINVSFVGILSGNDKIAAYKSTDVFVLPSYSENFGMVILEAMAAGVPVIVSKNVGLAEEIMNYHAGVVVNNNINELEEAIIQLLNNTSLANNNISNAYDMINKKFSIDRVADLMINELKTIIKNYK